MISEEKLNLNYTNWINRLQKYNCYSESMINELGDKIMLASFSMNKETGTSYPGSMIDIVLNKLCKIAYDINKCFLENHHEELGVNIEMIMRVLLLQHISKAQIFEPEEDKYWIGRGRLYKFNNKNEASLKTGERSIYLCQKYGIVLTELEFDAMKSIDREDDDFNMYENPLTFIIRTANRAIKIEQKLAYDNIYGSDKE